MALAESSLRTLTYTALLGAMTACGSASTPYSFGPAGDSGGGGPDGTVSSSGDDGGGGGPSGYSSSGAGVSSGGGTLSGGALGGDACAPSCTTDLDCQNSCPPVASGSSSCCEVSTSTCYSSPTSTCPSQPVGAAE